MAISNVNDSEFVPASGAELLVEAHAPLRQGRIRTAIPGADQDDWTNMGLTSNRSMQVPSLQCFILSSGTETPPAEKWIPMPRGLGKWLRNLRLLGSNLGWSFKLSYKRRLACTSSNQG